MGYGTYKFALVVGLFVLGYLGDHHVTPMTGDCCVGLEENGGRGWGSAASFSNYRYGISIRLGTEVRDRSL